MTTVRRIISGSRGKYLIRIQKTSGFIVFKKMVYAHDNNIMSIHFCCAFVIFPGVYCSKMISVIRLINIPFPVKNL